MTRAPIISGVPRPWWEARWCIALALVLSAVPSAWPVTPAAAAMPMLAAAAMLWLSHVANGRIQPSAYVALPFAALSGGRDDAPAMALVLAAFALWLRLGHRVAVRAVAFVAISALAWAVSPLGWLCLAGIVFAAELIRARAVETDGVRRAWGDAGWRAARVTLPIAPPVLMLLAWHPAIGGDWMAALHAKPAVLLTVLHGRWPLFDLACEALVALLIYRSYADRRFRHAPMLAAAALALLILFVVVPSGADRGIAPWPVVLALLSIRFDARVTRRRRSALAGAALAFLTARTLVPAVAVLWFGP